MTIQVPGNYDLDTVVAQQEAAVRASTQGPSADWSGGAAPSPPSEEKVEKPETWEDRLAAAKISPDQAYEILSSLLQRGYFERTFALYGGKVSVTLRSRLAWHRTRHLEALDTLRTNDPRVHSELEFRYSLAGSLVRLGDTAYPVVEATDPSEKANEKLDKSLSMLSRIPDTLLTQGLYPLLSRFDAAVYAALSQGAPASF